MSIKVLEGVQPFNKFLFRSCYYHQMIAAYSFFGVDASFLLANYFPVCGVQNNRSKIFTHFLEVFNENELEKISGVKIIKQKEYEYKDENLINKIRHDIDRNMPVILMVNTFDLPYRDDAYCKIHYSHYILIHGYDDDTSEFIVNEHTYFNSNIYAERRVSYHVVQLAAQNILLDEQLKDNSTYIKFAKVKINFFPPFKLENTVGIVFNKIEKQHKNFKKWCKNFIHFVRFNFNLTQLVEKSTCIKSVIQVATMQKFMVMYFEWHKNDIVKFDKVCNLANFICGLVQKIVLKNKATKAQKRNIIRKIKELTKAQDQVLKIFKGGKSCIT